MKLFTKYNRINLLSTVIIFLLASTAFYFLIRYVILSRIDEDLVMEKNEILIYNDKYNGLPVNIETEDQYTQYRLVNRLPENANRIYTRKIHSKKEKEPVRTIDFAVEADHKFYLVSVSEPLEGTEDLIQSIIFITIGTIVLILTATFFINRFVLQRLWQPFYKTLEKVQQFQLSNNEIIRFSNSNIDEFNLLNATLSHTVNKAQRDYLILKEFTENASHELQTPLAVIRSKLDLLIQSEDLTAMQSQTLQGAYDAIKNLTKLNHSILLLAKIENGQFSEKTNLNLQQIIKNKQSQFAEQWQSQHIIVQAKTTTAYINGNPNLIDILVNNLLSNATRHNVPDGLLSLDLQPNQLQVSNSGEPKPLDEQHLYNRFYKGSSSTGKHGLGLSIVKQICDASGYTCRYNFKLPNTHSFVISWY